MAQELVVQTFNNAIQEQVPILIKATGLNQQELQSKLISFAYATKKMLEASKQSITNLDPQSIREAFKDSLDAGIPVDGRQLAYVIKYGNTIQYSIGYKGFSAKIKEIYPTAIVKAELVYTGDVFTVEKVDGQARYTHKVANPFASIKDMLGAYAYVKYTVEGKEYSFIETIGREEINKIKGKAKTKYVWDDWYGEMAKKSAIRRLCKILTAGNPKLAVLEKIDNKNFDIQQEPVHIDYDQPKEMPKEIQPNKADVIAQQEQVVEQEIKEDTATEVDITDNIFVISDIMQKTGKTNAGRDYTLSTLTFTDGTMVKTYDKKDYQKGMTVELVEWDKEQGKCKKVNIL